jgi:hypothetical protein
MAPRLASLLENCMRHLRYLKAARERLPRPMVAGHFADLPDELVAALDQFAFRFVRLQDTMGASLFRAFLVEKLKEPYEDAPLRDVLDRLEALRLLDSAGAWERIRAMRNALAHDYPESAEEKAATLNVAIEMAGQMDAVLQRLRTETG